MRGGETLDEEEGQEEEEVSDGVSAGGGWRPPTIDHAGGGQRPLPFVRMLK